ncbi:MAG: GmrSD restriction endonuclease domain-containing protein [Metamycoplasmataceae bacterium]
MNDLNKDMNKRIENTQTKCIILLEDIKNKRVSVPNFQRDYVWNKLKIVEFLNSQLNKEPFGTIILWYPVKKLEGIETKNEFTKILSRGSRNNNDNGHLIDGQQRTTSLLIILYSLQLQEEFRKLDKDYRPRGWNFGLLINFDYIERKFTLDKTIKSTLALSDIFGEYIYNDEIRGILKENDPTLSNDELWKYVNHIVMARDTIRNMDISVIKLINHSLDEVIDIFSNINTKGTKLSNFDLVHAKWSNLYDPIENKKFDFGKRLAKLLDSFDSGYEKLDKEVFIDSLYLHIDDEPKYSSEDKISFVINPDNTDQLIKKFDETIDAFKLTFKFLKGIGMSYKFIPSKIFFKWLSYFYLKTNNKASSGVEADIIRYYIKLASINERYGSSSNEKLKKDIEFVNDVLLSKDIRRQWEIWKSKTKNKYFEKTALTNNVLENITYKTSSMIANYIRYILVSSTKSFFKGEVLSNINNVDMHHIFPKNSDVIKENIKYKELVESIVNTTPLSSDENKHIGNNNPSKYINKLENKATWNFDQILKEHGINKDHLAKDDFKKFFEERSKFILNKVNDEYNF